jgi:hypothetical protein
MIHQRERLALRLEARDHTFGIHPEADHLERHLSPHGLLLFGQINHAMPTLADAFDQAIAADAGSQPFVARCRGFGMYIGLEIEQHVSRALQL